MKISLYFHSNDKCLFISTLAGECLTLKHVKRPTLSVMFEEFKKCIYTVTVFVHYIKLLIVTQKTVSLFLNILYYILIHSNRGVSTGFGIFKLYRK